MIDLDRVALAMGRDATMHADLKFIVESMIRQMNVERDKATENLNVMKSRLNRSSSLKEVEEYQAASRAAQAKLDELQSLAKAKVEEQRDKMVQSFREEVRPIAVQVSKSHGAQLVMTKNNAVAFFYDQSIDITDEVIAEIKAHPTEPMDIPPTSLHDIEPEPNPRQSSMITPTSKSAGVLSEVFLRAPWEPEQSVPLK